MRTDKHGRSYRGIAKSSKAVTYHEAAFWTIRSARPGKWRAPAGEMRIRVWLYLARTIDTDNVLKVLSDALEAALDINDSKFLWCIMERHLVSVTDARVEIEVCDTPEH